MGVIWHFLPLLSWLVRQSLWENGKNELDPRTLCLSVWPALSKAVDPQGPEGSAETFLTIRCLGRREWHSQGRYSSALFSTQLGPAHIIPSPHHSTPSQWQREKTTVKQCRADQACLLTYLSAKSTHTLQQAHTNSSLSTQSKQKQFYCTLLCCNPTVQKLGKGTKTITSLMQKGFINNNKQNKKITPFTECVCILLAPALCF